MHLIRIAVVVPTALACLAGLLAAAEDVSLESILARVPAEAALVIAVKSPEVAMRDAAALVGPALETDKVREAIGEIFRHGTLAVIGDPAGPVVLAVVMDEEGRPVVLEARRLATGSALPGEVLEGGVMKTFPPHIQMPGPEGGPPRVPPPEYLREIGPWVVRSASEALVRSVGTGATFAGAAALARRMETQLVAGTMDVPRFKPLIQAMRQQMEAQRQGAGPGGAPSGLGKLFDGYGALVDQIETVDFRLRMGAAGAEAAFDVRLREGEAMLEAARALHPVDPKAGPALPAGDGLSMAAWARLDWPKAIPAMQALYQPLIDIVAEGLEPEPRKQLEAFWEDVGKWKDVLGPGLAFSLEPASPGHGMFAFVETFDVADAGAYEKLMGEWMTAGEDLMKAYLQQFGMLPGGVQMDTTMAFRKKAETIEGVAVDHMTLQWEIRAPEGASPEMVAGMRQALEAMYGPGGLVIRMALVEKVGVVTLGGPRIMARAVRTARGGAPALHTVEPVASALAKMPPGAIGAAILNAPSLIRQGLTMTDRMMLDSLPSEVQERAATEAPWLPVVSGETPPARMAVALEDRTLGIGVAVPAEQVRATVRLFAAVGARMEWFMHEHRKLQMRQMEPASGETPPSE